MKRLLVTSIFIILFILMSGCAGNKENSRILQGEYTSNSAYKPSDSIISESIDSKINGQQKLLFTPENYESIPELEGLALSSEQVTVNKEQFLSLISNPISFAPMHFIDTTGALLLSDPNRIIKYSLQEIDDMESDFNLLDMTYFVLPRLLSNQLEFSNVNGVVGGLTIDRNVVIDRENRVLLVLDNKNIGSIPIIKKAIKFNEESKLNNLKVIGGYIHDDSLRIVFAQGDYAYTVESDSLVLVESTFFSGWDTLSGSEGYKKGKFYLYQVDNKGNTIRKIDLFSQEIILEHEKEEFLLEGEILDIASEVDLIYFLTVDKGTYRIYQSNEKKLHFVNYKEVFDDGTPFSKIAKIGTKVFGRVSYLVVFQKEGKYPVRLIDGTATDWKELKFVEQQD